MRTLGLKCPRADDGADVFTAQRGSQAARHAPVHNLHVPELMRGGHDLQECAVHRQRALTRCEIRNRGCCCPMKYCPNKSTSSALNVDTIPSAAVRRG